MVRLGVLEEVDSEVLDEFGVLVVDCAVDSDVFSGLVTVLVTVVGSGAFSGSPEEQAVRQSAGTASARVKICRLCMRSILMDREDFLRLCFRLRRGGGGYRQHAVVKRAIEGSNIDALRQGDAASEAGGGLTDHVLAVVFFRLLLAVGGDGEVAVLGIDFEPKNLRELSKIQRNRGE